MSGEVLTDCRTFCGELIPKGQGYCDACRPGSSGRPGRGTAAVDASNAAVLERDGHRCVKCGSTTDLEVDHKVPVAAGGSEALSNKQTLCRPCNRRKGDRVE